MFMKPPRFLSKPFQKSKLFPRKLKTKKKWLGSIDGLENRRVHGWAKSSSSEESQLIDIYVNDVPVIVGHPANILREDVRDARIGTGFYGFDVIIENFVSSSEKKSVVSIRGSKTKEIIAEKEFDFNPFRRVYLSSIDSFNNKISGWFVNKGNSNDVFKADIYINDIFYTYAENVVARNDLKNKKISGGLGGFSVNIPIRFMHKGAFSTYLRFEDGSQSRSASLVVDKDPPLPVFAEELFLRRLKKITVVVPVYNAVEDVEVCINRLLAFTNVFARIIIINDKSTDEKIEKILSKYETEARLKILRNEQNLGFTKTINRGIGEAPHDDIILLNSDARVTPGWVEGLLMAAMSTPRVATVTAMSDRAGAFSAPAIGNSNDLPEGVDEITFARAFRRRSLGLYPRVPTGNGFCMLVSRESIDSIGLFDTDAFPKGYGEENDFCMRALRAGWHNLVDDRTYVFHERTKSFGASKAALITAGRSVVDERYPEYKKAIQIFNTNEKLLFARYNARRALKDCVDRKNLSTRILFVVSTSTGGTPQTNRDLMGALSGHFEGWLLRCDSFMLELSRMVGNEFKVVHTHTLNEYVDPISHQSPEYDAIVGGWLYHYDFDLVHIRHIGWHSTSLPRIAKLFDKKIIFSFHDYYVLTPTIKLLDDDGVYLGKVFRQSGSAYRESIWPKDALPIPAGTWLDFWRQRFEAMLKNCDSFVTTSESARGTIMEGIPSLPEDRFHVIPHGRDFPQFHKIRHGARHGEPIRILVPGNINAAKGLDVIFALAEHDKARCIEFHILGELPSDLQKRHRHVIVHGRYDRLDFAKKAADIHPHVGAIFSIWNETYCHTLTELWSVGLPAMVFDFPTVASRVRESGAGWVLDHRNIPALYEKILQIVYDSEEEKRVDLALSEWQNGYGIVNTTQVMAASYLDIYREALRTDFKPLRPNPHSIGAHSRPRIAVVCPSDKSLRFAPGSTHIRVWERTLNTIERDITFVRVLPESLLAHLHFGTFDGAIIQRTAVPRTMVDILSNAFAQSNFPYLLDLDDDLLSVPAEKDRDGFYADYAPHLQQMIKQAARLTVSTPPLVELMSRINSHTSLLPNALSDRLWRSEPAARTSDHSIRALYMGTKTHDADIRLILPALDAVAAAIPEFRLALVGAVSDLDTIGTGRSWIQHLPLPPETSDYEAFVPWLQAQASQLDFAIAPLEDSEFNKCKSNLKLFDYAALGLPVLASAVNTYRTDAPSVRLVDNSIESWIAALKEQIALGAENRVRGMAQRDWVLRKHMLSDTLDDYDAFLLDMIGVTVKPVH